MDYLQKNNLNKQNFSLFIRDLSQSLNSNLNKIIYYSDKDGEVVTRKEKKAAQKIKRKKVVKSKQVVTKTKFSNTDIGTYNADMELFENMKRGTDPSSFPGTTTYNPNVT